MGAIIQTNKNKLNKIYAINENLQKIELIDFSLITVEKHKNGKPHFHIIIGTRSICYEIE